MADEGTRPDQEIDCEVTVYDGSWGTCDMVTDPPARETPPPA